MWPTQRVELTETDNGVERETQTDSRKMNR